MHEVDQTTDMMVRSVLAYAENRLRMDPVPLDKGTLPAAELWDRIAHAAWASADPGLQFDTTINDWHTCPVSGRINGSNPCSEYMHVDDSACNLASLNLMRFVRDDGELDPERLRRAIDIVFTAQEIMVGFTDYPTAKITKNAKSMRQLGLGYANLGALLMMRAAPTPPRSPRS